MKPGQAARGEREQISATMTASVVALKKAGLSNTAIGRDLGISRQRVGQILAAHNTRTQGGKHGNQS